MVRRNADMSAKLFVGLMDREVVLLLDAVMDTPDTGECSIGWRWKLLEIVAISQVGVKRLQEGVEKAAGHDHCVDMLG